MAGRIAGDPLQVESAVAYLAAVVVVIAISPFLLAGEVALVVAGVRAICALEALQKVGFKGQSWR